MWAPLVVLDLGNTRPPPDVAGVTMVSLFFISRLLIPLSSQGVVALRPLSEGSVTIKSTSIWDAPLIDGK
jgi:hypothetical protein